MSFPPFAFGFGTGRSSPLDPLFLDPSYSDTSFPRFGYGDDYAFSAVADARIDWKETHEARVFKVGLPDWHKRGVKVEVGGSSVQISGERNCKREKKTDTEHRVKREKKIETRHLVEREKMTETWHRIEREKITETWHCVERGKKTDTRPRVASKKKTDSGEVLRSFLLPVNVKADQVEVVMKNRMLMFNVPKEVVKQLVKKPSGKSIKIYADSFSSHPNTKDHCAIHTLSFTKRVNPS